MPYISYIFRYKEDEKVKTYFIPHDTKRNIYVLSDVHMGSSWTKDSVSELRQFESYLKGIALSTAHSVILLGDVFDLWATPIDQRPISLDEMKQEWMLKPVMLCFSFSTSLNPDRTFPKYLRFAGRTMAARLLGTSCALGPFICSCISLWSSRKYCMLWMCCYRMGRV